MNSRKFKEETMKADILLVRPRRKVFFMGMGLEELFKFIFGILTYLKNISNRILADSARVMGAEGLKHCLSEQIWPWIKLRAVEALTVEVYQVSGRSL